MRKYNFLLSLLLLVIILFSPIMVSANPSGPSSGAQHDTYVDEDGNPIGQADPDDLEPPESSMGANSFPGAGVSGLPGSSNSTNSSTNNSGNDGTDGCTYNITSGNVSGSVTITIVDDSLDYQFRSNSGNYNLSLNASSTHLTVADFEDRCPAENQLVVSCTQQGVNRQCHINHIDWIEDNIDDPWDNDDDWDQLGADLSEDNFNSLDLECPDIINMEEGKLGWLLNMILNYIRIIGPVLVVLLSAIDFIKAVIGTDEKAMKEAQSKLIIRLVAAIALFLVPTLVQLLLSFINATTCTLG